MHLQGLGVHRVRMPAACRRTLLSVYAMSVVAHSSWVARPLSHYAEGAPERGAEHGVRRFSHAERHSFEDGSEMELEWGVEADPATILELDVEDSIRLLECRPEALLLEVPNEHLHRVSAWHFVTASDTRHGCSHLKGKDLYRRVHGIKSVPVHEPRRKGANIALSTEELPSHDHIFPRSRFRFAFLPAAARWQGPGPDENVDRGEDSDEEQHAEPQPRRLSTFFRYGQPTVESSLTPVATNEGNSMINFHIPHQLSNLAWNWDYSANSTKNPQFKYTFPGGIGYMRLYKPYFKSHLGLSVNFSSRLDNIMKSPPHVNVHGVLQGFADFNADIAAAMNFNTDSSASMFDNILDHIELPNLLNISHELQHIKPLKFYIGGSAVTIVPGFSCKMKAYHLGQLKGSMRVSLASKIWLQANMHFDTDAGLETHVSAKMLDVQFTPPTWMLYTQHFELGIMLEPELWLSGSFGELKDMEMGICLRPYLNVSIVEQRPETEAETAELVVYPFRMIGMPTGRSYAVEVCVNGACSRTGSLLSIGLVEFQDSIELFNFGLVSLPLLNTTTIEVALFEDGVRVAQGQTSCAMEIGGICRPSPMSVPLEVRNSTAIVQVNAYWKAYAMHAMKKKVRSISIRFPMVTLMQGPSEQLKDPEIFDSARLVLKHNGQTFGVPLSKTRLNSTMILESRILYELGPVFVESWSYIAPPGVPSPLFPLVEVTLMGQTIARGVVPSLAYQSDSGMMDSASMMTGGFGKFKSSVETISLTAPLYSPDAAKAMMGTAKVEFSLLPPHRSAFFVHPSEAAMFTTGESYELVWVAEGTHKQKEQTFYISAKIVDPDGSITEGDWLHTVHVQCEPDASLQLHRYFGQDEPCAFRNSVVMPELLAGYRGVIVINWMDEQVNPYEMISPLLEFTAARRLDSRNAKMWGTQSLGETTKRGFGTKVKTKLHNLASHCHSQPLKYGVGAGINLVEHMKHLAVPTPMIGGDGGPSHADWVSNPTSIFELGRKNQTKLSSVLPKSLCDDGICEGLMPGCQKIRASPRHIKQIQIKLSRFFRWKKHIGPKLRHIIAYGLALLPSSIQIGGHQLETEAEHLEEEAIEYLSKTTTKSTTPSTTTASPTTTTAARTTPTSAPTTTMPTTPAATTSAATTIQTTAATAAAGSPAIAVGQAAAAPLGPAPGATPMIQPNAAPAERRLGAAPAAPTGQRSGVWEVEAEDTGEPEPEEKAEFDTFVVRIREPMHYELTEELLRGLLSRGAFRGIEDGNEDTLGPILIRNLTLLEPPLERPLAAEPAKEATGLFAREAPRIAAAALPRLVTGRSLVVASCAAAIALFSVLLAVAAIARKRGYIRLVTADFSMEQLA